MTLNKDSKFALLVYDFPRHSKLRNPSMLLRRWGARINLSCWVLPIRNLALVPLKEWMERGATVEVVEFDEHERDKVVALARRAIMRDVEEMRGYVDKATAKVRRRFAHTWDCATGSTERAEAQKDAERFAYAALYRAKAVADAAEEAALHFDLTADVAHLVRALRGTIKAKSALWFHLQREARAGVMGPAMRGLPCDEQYELEVDGATAAAALRDVDNEDEHAAGVQGGVQ